MQPEFEEADDLDHLCRRHGVRADAADRVTHASVVGRVVAGDAGKFALGGSVVLPHGERRRHRIVPPVRRGRALAGLEYVLLRIEAVLDEAAETAVHRVTRGRHRDQRAGVQDHPALTVTQHGVEVVVRLRVVALQREVERDRLGQT